MPYSPVEGHLRFYFAAIMNRATMDIYAQDFVSTCHLSIQLEIELLGPMITPCLTAKIFSIECTIFIPTSGIQGFRFLPSLLTFVIYHSD